MNAFDISPFFRSTVGFDRLFDQLDRNWRTESAWPQYDVLKTDDDHYRITIAVPGYRQEDINIEAREGMLTVTGERSVDPDHNQYLYRGIGGQTFSRTFQLAEHVIVQSAHLSDGLLAIELRRELPEALKPRKIEVEAVTKDEPKTIESKAA